MVIYIELDADRVSADFYAAVGGPVATTTLMGQMQDALVVNPAPNGQPAGELRYWEDNALVPHARLQVVLPLAYLIVPLEDVRAQLAQWLRSRPGWLERDSLMRFALPCAGGDLCQSTLQVQARKHCVMFLPGLAASPLPFQVTRKGLAMGDLIVPIPLPVVCLGPEFGLLQGVEADSDTRYVSVALANNVDETRILQPLGAPLALAAQFTIRQEAAFEDISSTDATVTLFGAAGQRVTATLSFEFEGPIPPKQPDSSAAQDTSCPAPPSSIVPASIGALGGAGLVLALALGVWCCRRRCASSPQQRGFQRQVDMDAAEEKAAVGSGDVAVEMVGAGGGGVPRLERGSRVSSHASAAASHGTASPVRQGEIGTSSPSESDTLIEREAPPALARSVSGASASSAALVSLDLQARPALAAAQFESRWEALRTLDMLDGVLAGGISAEEVDVEGLLAPLHVHCIASGVVGGVQKQYFYALGGDGTMYAAEVALTPSNRRLSTLIKGPAGSSGQAFARLLSGRLQGLLAA